MPTYQQPSWERMISLGCGIVVLGFFLAIVWRNEPFTDPNNVTIARVLLSLGAAIVGGTIPGFLQVSWRGTGFVIRAAGALGLFVITYFGTPQVIAPFKTQTQICKSFITIGHMTCTLVADDSARKTAIEQISAKSTAAVREQKLATWLNGYNDYKIRILENPSKETVEKLISAPSLKAQAAILDQQASSQETELAKIYFTRALNADLQFDFPTAASNYEKAFNLDPNNANYAEKYAATLCDRNKFNSAVLVYAQAESLLRQSQSTPDDKDSLACLLQNIGILYETMGNFDAASRKAQDALAIREDLAKTYPVQKIHAAWLLANIANNNRRLGNSELTTKFFEQAEQAFDALPSSAQRDLNYAYFLSTELLWLRKLDKQRADGAIDRAYAFCEKYSNPIPDNPREWLELCSFPYTNKLETLVGPVNHDAAVKLIDRILYFHSLLRERRSNETKTLAKVHQSVGDWFYDENKSCDLAISHYSTSVTLLDALGDAAALSYALNNRGWMFFLCHKYREAEPDFRRASTTNPKSSNPVENLALVSAFLQSPKVGYQAFADVLVQFNGQSDPFRRIWRYIADCRGGAKCSLTRQPSDDDPRAELAFKVLLGEENIEPLLDASQSAGFDLQARRGLAFYAGQLLVIGGNAEKAGAYFEVASQGPQSPWLAEGLFALAELNAKRD